MYFDDFKVEHVKSPVVSLRDYYPFGLTHRSYQRENSFNNQYQYNGKELQDELDLGWTSYGSRFYSNAIGRWTTIDNASESYFSYGPYTYVRNNPVLRLDPTGDWDITVHLHNDRDQYGYGIAVVTDRNGKEIMRFAVRAEGIGGRDRMVDSADTPFGVYDMPDQSDIWRENTDNRAMYGPNPRMVMHPEEGEIVDSGRDGIRIHGGRQEEYNKETGEWVPIDDPQLKQTKGCLRVFDVDAEKLNEITDQSMANDPNEIGGKVTVSDDLLRFLKGDHEAQQKAKAERENFRGGLKKAVG